MDTSLDIIGCVASALDNRTDAPKQADEGAPHAWLRLQPGMRGTAIHVHDLEAIDRTPIIDIKPPGRGGADRRSENDE